MKTLNLQKGDLCIIQGDINEFHFFLEKGYDSVDQKKLKNCLIMFLFKDKNPEAIFPYKFFVPDLGILHVYFNFSFDVNKVS